MAFCSLWLNRLVFRGHDHYDQEIPYRQNLALRRISVLILCAPTNRLADLERLVPAALRALDSIEPGQVIRID